MDDHVKHLRTIHFSLVVTLSVLLVASQLPSRSDAQVAIAQLESISRIFSYSGSVPEGTRPPAYLIPWEQQPDDFLIASATAQLLGNDVLRLSDSPRNVLLTRHGSSGEPVPAEFRSFAAFETDPGLLIDGARVYGAPLALSRYLSHFSRSPRAQDSTGQTGAQWNLSGRLTWDAAMAPPNRYLAQARLDVVSLDEFESLWNVCDNTRLLYVTNLASQGYFVHYEFAKMRLSAERATLRTVDDDAHHDDAGWLSAVAEMNTDLDGLVQGNELAVNAVDVEPSGLRRLYFLFTDDRSREPDLPKLVAGLQALIDGGDRAGADRAPEPDSDTPATDPGFFVFEAEYEVLMVDLQSAFNDALGTEFPRGPFAKAFPELAKYTTHTKDLAFAQISAILRDEAQRGIGDIEIIGVKFPAADIAYWGLLAVFLLQGYFYLHMRAFVRLGGTCDMSKTPWIGCYDDCLSALATLTTVVILPVLVVSQVVRKAEAAIDPAIDHLPRLALATTILISAATAWLFVCLRAGREQT